MTYHPELTHLYLYGRLLASQLAIHKRDAEKYAHWQAGFWLPEYRGVDWSYLTNSAKFAVEAEAKLAKVRGEYAALVRGKSVVIENGAVYTKETSAIGL